ncbi:CLUMA_CG012497, isoform A [Clunio marinus]|uniref:CLUMA_CG012497, isoform A n=1 Tax=Clunio marinus TaxID=568069 RepID=A0A1J1II28_9DIPT|nr:CLUMA_CG012497, isoform A [Clunio marinus]
MTRMTVYNQLLYALIVFFLCTTIPIESRHRDRDRKKQREPSSLPSQQHHIIESKAMPINLCSKGRDMKLVCHCSPDNEHEKAQKSECWIFRSDLTLHDLDWTTFHTQSQLQNLGFSVHGTGNLSFIPTDVIQSLKFLEKLTIEYAQIHEIFGFAFGNFTRIRNITLSRNQIRTVNAYAFANHIELQELSLASNEIIEIDPFAFINLPALKRLNLAENQISTIQEDTFEHLDRLSVLNLSFNLIDYITREIFKGLGNLWNLSLHHNKLIVIEDDLFIELFSLRDLDLSHNLIERISERAFNGLGSLGRLNLENNRLRSLEVATFSTVPMLTHLNLMRNSLETITVSTIQPLMNNLVNHTSMLLMKENKLICDCRLGWVYDLRNRTKSFQLKYSMEEVECIMNTKNHRKGVRVSVNVDDSTRKKYSDDDPNYYEDERMDDKNMSNLLLIKANDLPCPKQYIQQFAHPSNQYIGFDLSHWIRSSSPKLQNSLQLNLILVSFLIHAFARTFGCIQ